MTDERDLELEEAVEDLPERDAMSLIDPTSLLGGGATGAAPSSGISSPLMGGSSTPPADPSQVPADPSTGMVPSLPPINVPHMPVPTSNPGGAYTPDSTATNQT